MIKRKSVDELERGDRVQLHPCTDQWMQGDRYGTITGAKHCPGSAPGEEPHGEFRVKLDISGRSIWLHEGNVLHTGNSEH